MEIPQIKQQLEITTLAEHLNIQINTKTKRALCPFHPDKIPSLQFSKDKQIATCFSSNCNAGTMDVISLTEKKLNLSTHEALNYLTELITNQAPTLVQSDRIEPSRNVVEVNNKKQTPMIESPTLISSQDQINTFKEVFKTFETAFLASSPAKNYAKQRMLNIKTLTIGYNAGTLHHGELNNTELINTYQELGLLNKTNSGYASFGLASLVFGLRDKQNNVTGMYFRAVEPRPSKFKNRKFEKHLYLKNRTGLYPNYPSPNTQKIILTESIIDAATLQSYPEALEGYEILALYGTNGLTTEHIHALQNWTSSGVEKEEIILFFDGDSAGTQANKKHSTYLQDLFPDLKISIVETLEDEDINSLAQAHKPEIFTKLLKERITFKPKIVVKQASSETVSSSGQMPNSVEQSSNLTEQSSSKAEQSSSKVEQSSSKVERSSSLVEMKANGLNTTNPNKITYQTDTATYYIKGGIRKDLDSLKVTLVIEHLEYKSKSRNKLDLYEDKQTEKIARESAEKLGLRADLIEFDLNTLTDLLDEYRESTTLQNNEEKKEVIIPKEQKDKCFKFLKSKKLLFNINDLIGKSGVVGEENNRLFLFGIASTYKMENTLHALIQGSSGSGKTHLLATIMDFMPPEDTINLTRVTESSFYNYGEHDLSNKLIGMEDFDGLEEKAELAFRELMSKGEISSSTSGKNEHTGQISAYVKTVFGPIASLSATTKGEIYEDNMSRCFLISVDESLEQTQRIIKYQNSRAAGLIDTNKTKENRDFLRDCIRLLKPLDVINPYANRIDLPSEAHKIRRLNELFQSYVKQMTLLNQYQRKKDVQGRLITDKQDVRTAVEIMFDSIILKVDELDGSLRLFYESLKNYVLQKSKEYEFTRREIRQEINISNTQLHRFFNQLIDLEYIYKSSGYDNKGHKYKIAYWDNMQAVRNRIKQDLNKQIDKL